MANWTDPVITNNYTDVMTQFNARDIDAATMFLSSPTNQPNGSIRLIRAPVKLQEWDSGAGLWTDRPVAIEGGGTAATSAVGARAALGIGTMGTQNSNAVAITGGTIVGLTQLDMSGSITFAADQAYNIGTLLKKVKKAYIGEALVVPVGVDKYATS